MLKVLVIDDEKATLTMFRLFLTAYGYEVLVAKDGRTGLELHAREKPSIVFTDLKMPEMDGFEVLKQIKKRDPSTEVIVITGHGDMDLIVQALNLEAIDFINKPVRRAALDSALKRAESRIQNPETKVTKISAQDSGASFVIRIRGTLNGQAKPALSRAVEDALHRRAKTIIFDFDSNTAINGVGMAILAQLLSDLRKKETAAVISGLSENFRSIFDTVGISRFAHVVEAISGASGPSEP